MCVGGKHHTGDAGKQVCPRKGGVNMQLSGKTALVFGVASEDSIAWAICQHLSAAGCKLVLGFQPRFRSRIWALKDKLNSIVGLYPLDVATDTDTAKFFSAWQDESPDAKADILVHAIGFAPRECFVRPLLFVNEEPLNIGMTISAHSLQRSLKHALPHLNPGSSTITLTYAASTRYVPNYAAMAVNKAALEAWVRELAARLGPEGHRVNAISSGPIRTIAASGVPGFDNILAHVERNAPLRRNVDQNDVAGCAVWLASPFSSAVTGQIIHVDAGYSITMVPESIMED